jgi:hypothetical protein
VRDVQVVQVLHHLEAVLVDGCDLVLIAAEPSGGGGGEGYYVETD